MGSIISSVDEFKSHLPKGTRYNITNEIVELVKNLGSDCGIFQDYMEESFLSHIPALREMKGLTLKSYIEAIKYCNLKQRMSNRDAWKIVFRDRYDRLVSDGKESQVDQNVAAFNKRPIVSKIDADMAVAVYIQYSPMRHAAIQKKFELMNGKASPSKVPVYKVDDNGKYVKDSYGRRKISKDRYGNEVFQDVHQIVSPKVQDDAASSLIELTAMPEEKDINIKIGISDEAAESQREIVDKLSEIAKRQKEALDAGASIDEVQKIGQYLVDAEIIDDE